MLKKLACFFGCHHFGPIGYTEYLTVGNKIVGEYEYAKCDNCGKEKLTWRVDARKLKWLHDQNFSK